MKAPKKKQMMRTALEITGEKETVSVRKVSPNILLSTFAPTSNVFLFTFFMTKLLLQYPMYSPTPKIRILVPKLNPVLSRQPRAPW